MTSAALVTRRRPNRLPVTAATTIRHAHRVLVDARARTVRLGGDEVHLCRREFDLLLFLVEHPRQVFTRAAGHCRRSALDHLVPSGEQQLTRTPHSLYNLYDWSET